MKIILMCYFFPDNPRHACITKTRWNIQKSNHELDKMTVLKLLLDYCHSSIMQRKLQYQKIIYSKVYIHLILNNN